MTNEPPVLRPLVEADLPDLIALQRLGAVEALADLFPQDSYPFPVAQVQADWARELSDPRVDAFVIVQDGHLAGFAAIAGNQFLHFGTEVTSWGTGLAGRAHDEVLHRLRSQGHNLAWLRVLEKNARAIRFYTRRGWAPTAETTRSAFPPYPILRRYEIVLD